MKHYFISHWTNICSKSIKKQYYSNIKLKKICFTLLILIIWSIFIIEWYTIITPTVTVSLTVFEKDPFYDISQLVNEPFKVKIECIFSIFYKNQERMANSKSILSNKRNILFTSWRWYHSTIIVDDQKRVFKPYTINLL